MAEDARYKGVDTGHARTLHCIFCILIGLHVQYVLALLCSFLSTHVTLTGPCIGHSHFLTSKEELIGCGSFVDVGETLIFSGP